MDISFATNKLAKILNDERKIYRNYGQRNGDLIIARLDNLTHATCLNEITRDSPDRCHELVNDRKGQLAVDVLHPYRLIFEPDHDPVPAKEDGGMNWEEITAIIIIQIVDYHG